MIAIKSLTIPSLTVSPAFVSTVFFSMALLVPASMPAQSIDLQPGTAQQVPTSDAANSPPSSFEAVAKTSSLGVVPLSGVPRDSPQDLVPRDAASPEALRPVAATPVDLTPVLTMPADREVSWVKMPGRIARDQRAIWLAPLKLKDRKYWLPTAVLLGATVGLVALDPPIAHFFHNTTAIDPFNDVFSGRNTSDAMWIGPAVLYGAGFLMKDAKMKSTALLIGEAVADSEILATVMKDIDRRTQPVAVPGNRDFTNSWFQDHSGSILQGHGSFPSGHTIAAFSIATVISRRYGNHKWVPWVAYSTATLIGFSRISRSAHFTSDVFAGGVLGYFISRNTVLHDASLPQ